MRLRGKRDACHARFKQRYEAHGCTVLDLANVGDGCPDLLVGIGGTQDLVEVKSLTGQLTPQQVDFCHRWRGPQVRIIRTDSEVDRHVSELRTRARV